jgi:ADP-L-glycero-D-manno-heptose 6-epimerase
MIYVTGGNGFIGTNLVNSLRSAGKEVHIVDFVGDVFCDPMSFLKLIREDDKFAQNIEVVYHQGACSDTTCYDPFYMMRVNLNYSIALLNICMGKDIRVIYASSAAVYGDGPYKDDGSTNPKNIYAKSKSMFDEYVMCFLNEQSLSQVVGLRYFNVYGPWEQDKGNIASVIYQFYNQIMKDKKIKIFKNSQNYTRDFISVEDLMKVNLHFYENEHISGIYNCGTGISRSFYDIAKIMQNYYDFEIEEIDMPEALHGKYQKYTCSDNSRLIEKANYTEGFFTLEEGIKRYIDFLETK